MKLLLFSLLFSGCFTNVFCQKKSFNAELSQNYLYINDLLIIDTEKAKQAIDSLELVNNITGNSKAQQELNLISIEFYRSTGDYAHMKHLLFQELDKINNETPLRVKLGLDYFKAANYGIENRNKKFLPLLEKTLLAAKKNHFRFLEAQCLTLYGNYYSRLEDYEKTQAYYIKAQNIYRSLKNFHQNALIEMKRGIAYFYEGKTEDALKLFHIGLKYSQSNHLTKPYCQYLSYIAEAHLFSENLDSAYIYYSAFLKKKDQADIRDVYEAYIGLEHYYNLVENVDSAYHYSKLVTEVNAYIKSTMDKALGDEFELEFNEREYLKRMNVKNLEVQQVKSKNESQWTTFTIIGCILTILLVYMFLSNRQKNKLNKQLSAQQEAIIQKNEIIDSALKEKEILLKEIHHRVKNNLQVISSLLHLQSKQLTDKKAIQVLEDGMERIQAIALIHHKLYQNETFSFITMSEYIPDLVVQLKKTYIREDLKIESYCEIADVNLSLDVAIPLGLIICEMITNSLKHAFEGKKRGLINLSIKAKDANYFEMILEDNGSGIPEDLKFPSEGSLGAEIITALSEQINGELTIESNKEGTRFILVFQDKPNQ